MFRGQTFYHQHIRKAVIAFGTIFNNINIERKNSSGVIVQALRVPLAYSTKQKFLTRIARVPDATTRGEVAITLPRMGFEIDGLNYDPSRKISVINDPPLLPINPTVDERIVVVRNKAVNFLTISWPTVTGVTQYQVQYRLNNGNFTTQIVFRPDFTIENSQQGKYEFRAPQGVPRGKYKKCKKGRVVPFN